MSTWGTREETCKSSWENGIKGNFHVSRNILKIVFPILPSSVISLFASAARKLILQFFSAVLMCCKVLSLYYSMALSVHFNFLACLAHYSLSDF